jgi:DNA-binding transcriptional MerR regulator
VHSGVSSPTLTAAECAARTGLTPRALRLYEEQGLITPGRNAGGWRLYGAEELARLNVITLLKSAGLTLVQIANVTGSAAQQPTLEKILAIQLESLKARRADAERGQRIAEAALERLNGGESLTVDDFCNLIRSLQMTELPDPTTSRPAEPETPGIDEFLLERYAGYYQVGVWNVMTVRRDGNKLLLDGDGVRPPVALRPLSECDFDMGGSGITITFDRGADGQATALRVRMKGGDMPGTRIDAATADQVKARLAERIKDSTPLPGSDIAVRRLVEGLIEGRPRYEDMHPALAHVTREQLPRLHTAAAYLGAIQSVDFQGVGSQGWDVYDVRQERGASRVRIILGSDGLMSGALFAIKEGPVSLGP